MTTGKRATRAAQTRSRLIAAARELFAAHGYAGAGTEQILAKTGDTRGGLYHHFADKAALFAAVCEEMHAEAADEIKAAVAAAGDEAGAFARLLAGCDAWIDAMARRDVRRILIIEAPTVLGWERWNDLDQRYGFVLLQAGIAEAQRSGDLPAIPPAELAILLNGAMNHAVLTAREPNLDEQLERSKQALHLILAALRAQAAAQSRPAASAPVIR